MGGRTARLGRTALILFAGWSLVALVFLHSALPAGPLNLGLERGYAFAVAPQWFGFFTRDPQQRQGLAFRRASGRWVKAVEFPFASSSNLLGWRREGRGGAAELDHLLGRISGDAFQECEVPDPISCLELAGRPGFEMPLETREPLLCGEIGVVRITPVTWETASSERSARPQMEYVLVEVQC